MGFRPEHSVAGPIYLDHNATTPVHPDVAAAMQPWLADEWGNPSSRHVYGARAAQAVLRAREQVAELLGASPDEIVFTSGGTEADNLAIRGAGPSLPRRIVISQVEHPAVAAPARELERRGVVVERLSVGPNGCVDTGEAGILDRPAGLVSVIWAQNETGVLQPLGEIAARARAADQAVCIHSDAAQAVGKVRVRPAEVGVDLLTIAGHKLYAPKGIGALYVRRGVDVRPLLFGGGQERGLRPGTENVASIVGLGAACALAAADLETEGARQVRLRERLWEALAARIPGLLRTGEGADTLPGTLHVCVPGCRGDDLLAATPGVAASTGSACHASDLAAPAVLAAMGLSPALAAGAIRLSLGRRTTIDEIDAAAAALGDGHRFMSSPPRD
jgi:cysteine desulfurase